jgi:acyl-coenzyme A thioesterase PaaI-like protein
MVRYQNEEKTMIEKKELIEKINSMAEFNKWCGIKVLSATEGAVEIQIEWRKEMGQYSGFLHAGLIGTLIDTACGFAAATMAGTKLIGEKFIARARVVKPGKQQIFTACDLFAVSEGEEKLVANGETLLCVI